MSPMQNVVGITRPALIVAVTRRSPRTTLHRALMASQMPPFAGGRFMSSVSLSIPPVALYRKVAWLPLMLRPSVMNVGKYAVIEVVEPVRPRKTA